MGSLLIAQCPRKELQAGTGEFVNLAEDAEEGNWPVGGGMLDQSHSFRMAYRYYRDRIAELTR